MTYQHGVYDKNYRTKSNLGVILTNNASFQSDLFNKHLWNGEYLRCSISSSVLISNFTTNSTVCRSQEQLHRYNLKKLCKFRQDV